MRHTHTYATLHLSRKSFQEIARKLKKAGYEDNFVKKDLISMQGIAVAPKPKARKKEERNLVRRSIQGFWVQWVRRKLWTVPGLFRPDGTGVRGTLAELKTYLRDLRDQERLDQNELG